LDENLRLDKKPVLPLSGAVYRRLPDRGAAGRDKNGGKRVFPAVFPVRCLPSASRAGLPAGPPRFHPPPKPPAAIPRHPFRPQTTGANTYSSASGGGPATISDQYRSPQICPDLPSITLNRAANVCLIHCKITGNWNPSAGLI
jgi:hypothetical protein